MGATLTALKTGNTRFCYVLAIEGYSYLITDNASTAAVVTAWAASSWTLCLPGLKVSGPIKRSIHPWQDSIDVPTIQLAVQPDDNDTFGKAVFQAKGTFNTRMTSTFNPATDGSGTINVKGTAGWDASGTVFIGGQAHAYASLGAGAFNISAGGANAHSPFSANAGLNLAGPRTDTPSSTSRTWRARSATASSWRTSGSATSSQVSAWSPGRSSTSTTRTTEARGRPAA